MWVSHAISLHRGVREVHFRPQMEGTLAVGFCRERGTRQDFATITSLRGSAALSNIARVCFTLTPHWAQVGQGLSTQRCFSVLGGSGLCEPPQRTFLHRFVWVWRFSNAFHVLLSGSSPAGTHSDTAHEVTAMAAPRVLLVGVETNFSMSPG